MRQFDVNMMRLASVGGFVYTRYADDLAISVSGKDFCRNKAEQLIQTVYEALRSSGLRPRTAKTRISPPGARKVVLGLLVDRDRPRLLKEFKERLELHVYHLVKRGPLVHLERRGFKTFGGMKDHIHGLLAYAEHVEPDFASPLMEQFKSIEWPL